MRIGIPSEKPSLEARVGTKFGTSQYLMIVDLRTMAVEAVPNIGLSGESRGGMQAVVLAISKKVNTILTGYCAPTAEKYLSANGIEVLTGVSGTVGEVLEQYKRGDLQTHIEVTRKSESKVVKIDRLTLFHGLRDSSNQFINLLPMLVCVVLLIGLFNAFVSKEFLSSLFSGNKALDTLWGACFGSILTGNPINSYIVLQEH